METTCSSFVVIDINLNCNIHNNKVRKRDRERQESQFLLLTQLTHHHHTYIGGGLWFLHDNDNLKVARIEQSMVGIYDRSNDRWIGSICSGWCSIISKGLTTLRNMTKDERINSIWIESKSYPHYTNCGFLATKYLNLQSFPSHVTIILQGRFWYHFDQEIA